MKTSRPCQEVALVLGGFAALFCFGWFCRFFFSSGWLCRFVLLWVCGWFCRFFFSSGRLCRFVLLWVVLSFLLDLVGYMTLPAPHAPIYRPPFPLQLIVLQPS